MYIYDNYINNDSSTNKFYKSSGGGLAGGCQLRAPRRGQLRHDDLYDAVE